MNALVLYVGTQAISHIRNKGLAPNMSTIAHSAHMDIFQNLAVDLDTEGEYWFVTYKLLEGTGILLYVEMKCKDSLGKA